MAYRGDLAKRMYLYFAEYSEPVGLPSFEKFARSIGVTLEELSKIFPGVGCQNGMGGDFGNQRIPAFVPIQIRDGVDQKGSLEAEAGALIPGGQQSRQMTAGGLTQ